MSEQGKWQSPKQQHWKSEWGARFNLDEFALSSDEELKEEYREQFKSDAEFERCKKDAKEAFMEAQEQDMFSDQDDLDNYYES